MDTQIVDDFNNHVQVMNLSKLKANYPNTLIRNGVVKTKIAGVSYRQEIVAKLCQNDLLWLEREPNNQFDVNAIRVVRNNQESLGYINKYLARDLAPCMDAFGHPLRAKVVHLTGSSFDGFLLGAVITFKLPMPHRFKKNSQYLSIFDIWDYFEE